ncbi:ubiquinone/menaquinone biosynthesis C-methylase UbiE [Evansella vedderi]|uniref:Ubiquinone/menaquinone biosynthesis C-methylase UbiE n=1 Tax=Evansella vedderi TaxID=38282 RepID=A0ABU0A3D7_9BACI|nr:methyltransferase domain-containing protein [Evansella vedderi]MDQ0256870.1 ubiquinone/menaquinone biosynthesis C-methylase UbiE [Evansella vedderi]
MTKSNVQKQFGKNANAYVTSNIHRLGNDLQKLVEITNTNGQEIVLDIATGGGHVANALAPHVKQVTALDITKEMLQEAEKFIKSNGHTNVDFVEGNGEKLPFSSNSFHIVTCRIAPHHFTNIDSFVSEVARVLIPGGQFLLDDNVAPEDNELDMFYNTVEKKRDYSHYRAWKKTEWIKLLEEKGFVIEELHRFEKTFIFEDWCNRMQLHHQEKEALEQFMLDAPLKAKHHFQIKENDKQIISFQGEAVLIKAVKQG